MQAFEPSAFENVENSTLSPRIAGRSGRNRRYLTQTNLQAAAVLLEGAPISLANGVPAQESGSTLTKTSINANVRIGGPVSPTNGSSETKVPAPITDSPTQVKMTGPMLMAMEVAPTVKPGAPVSPSIGSSEKKAPAPIAGKTDSPTQVKMTAPMSMANEVPAPAVGGNTGSSTNIKGEVPILSTKAGPTSIRGTTGSNIKPKPKVPTPTKAKPVATREAIGTIPVAMIG